MEIEEFFKLYQHSVWYKNSSTMINLYDEQAVIFDMWNEGYNVNPSAWAKTIANWFGSLGEEKVKVEFEMIKIHQSQDVGFASALIRFQAISTEGAVLRSMRNRITLGFSKSAAGWKVIHQHTSAPINSNGLTAILDI
jgi:ketosteroid isomerase-like protein